MNRWCELAPEQRISPGDFLEAALRLQSGLPIDSEPAFLAEWARRLMHRYESQPLTTPLVLDELPIEQPRRTKWFYRRLFEPISGQRQDAFNEWAGEVLIDWLEQSLEPMTHFAVGNSPHSSDPAFDVLTVFSDGSDLRLRVVQVKVTEANLQSNCNIALAKLQKLENGEYQAELLSRLDLLISAGRLGNDVSIDSLVYRAPVAYRIAVLHGEDRSTKQILTNYDQRITGPTERRSVRLTRPSLWSSMWDQLATLVYAQLTN